MGVKLKAARTQSGAFFRMSFYQLKELKHKTLIAVKVKPLLSVFYTLKLLQDSSRVCQTLVEI